MKIRPLLKRIICVAASLTLAFVAVGCKSTAINSEKPKITVCATLFPQYDFCRALGGDNVSVKLILPPGMESHSYEPSVSDVLEISGSDIFIYTGSQMEPWAETIIEALDTDVLIVDASENIELIEHSHGIEPDGDDHDHEEEYDHDEHEADPHIWTSPANAAIMVDNITAALCSVDAENSGLYSARASAYKSELYALDGEFYKIAENASSKLICHGGRFSMNYFAKRYGFEFTAAFDSCSSQAEPSMARVASMIDTVKEHKLKAVFYEELTEPKVARVIADATGAEVLLLHTCHNVSKSELEAGVTYLSLMKQNAANLRKALL